MSCWLGHSKVSVCCCTEQVSEKSANVHFDHLQCERLSWLDHSKKTVCRRTEQVSERAAAFHIVYLERELLAGPELVNAVSDDAVDADRALDEV